MSEDKTFTCDGCGETFRKGRTDEDAEKEAIEMYGRVPPKETLAVLCDNCFKEIVLPRMN